MNTILQIGRLVPELAGLGYFIYCYEELFSYTVTDWQIGGKLADWLTVTDCFMPSTILLCINIGPSFLPKKKNIYIYIYVSGLLVRPLANDN